MNKKMEDQENKRARERLPVYIEKEIRMNANSFILAYIDQSNDMSIK